MPGESVYTRSIAITGHRTYPDRGALFKGLDQLHAKQYYFGGARGVDSDALEYISRTQPASQRTVVIPDRLSRQPRATIGITQRHATRVIELGNTGTDRYMIRNRYIVDKSQHLRAFYDYRGRGGTFNTINYARSQGKPVSITSMVETDLSRFKTYSDSEFRTWMNTQRSNGVPQTSVKGVIMGYFKGAYGHIPPAIVQILQAW